MPLHKNPVNFDPDAENKSFSTGTPKPNQCRSTTLKWSHFRQPTLEPNPIHRALEPSQFGSPHWNQVNWDHPSKVQVNLHAHTENTWFPARFQKPSQFRPPTQQPNQFHHYTEFESIYIPTVKSSSFWCRDPRTKLISIPTPKPSQFRHTLKLSKFRSLHWNQVKFDRPHEPSQFRSKH